MNDRAGGRGAAASRRHTPRRRVLLIESNEDNRDLYSTYLRECGFSVTAAASSDEALAHAAAADAIVTALAVRRTSDGVEFIRRVRHDAATAHTPVIVLTAYVSEPYRQQALAAGCNLFVNKPCLPEVLVEEIDRLIGTRSVLSSRRPPVRSRKRPRPQRRPAIVRH